MERVDVLREQAAILRSLASSFDDQAIRDQFLELAARCDEMAKKLEENPKAAGLQPSPLTDLTVPNRSSSAHRWSRGFEQPQALLTFCDHAVNGFEKLLVGRHATPASVVRDALAQVVDGSCVVHASSIGALALAPVDLPQPLSALCTTPNPQAPLNECSGNSTVVK